MLHIDGLLRDLRHAARGLARNPALVAVSALSISLGIGLNAVLYMGISTIYWHQPSATGVDRIVGVEPGNANQFSYPDYRDLERSGGFRTSTMTLGSGTGVSRAGVMVVTASFFETWGVAPAMGRTFGATDAAVEREPRVAVVTHGVWRARLGAPPNLAGATIRLDGETFDIVGVLPENYRAVTGWMGPSIYVPVSRLTLPSSADRRAPSLTCWDGSALPARSIRPALS